MPPPMSHRRIPRPPVPVAIDGLDANGIGTGLDDRGRRWTIRGAVPGSHVLAGGKPGAGVLLDLVQPPPDAIPAPCPQFGICGGCLYQSLPRETQHAAKLAALNTLLAPLDAESGRIRFVEGDGYGYRNRMELSFGVDRYLTRADQVREQAGEPIDRSGRFLGLHGPGRFDRIVDAGGDVLRHAGYFAINSLRMEKGYRHWGHDIGEEDTPIEAGAEELALVSDPRAEEFVGGRVVGLVWIQNVVGGLGEAVDGLAAGVHAAADRDAGEARARGERVSLDHVH